MAVERDPIGAGEFDELVATLGSDSRPIDLNAPAPVAVMMVGLQGSGKTTTTGKLARWLSKNGHSPLMVSVDVYRPAARLLAKPARGGTA